MAHVAQGETAERPGGEAGEGNAETLLRNCRESRGPGAGDEHKGDTIFTDVSKLDDRSAGVFVGEKSPSQQPWQVQGVHSTGVLPTAHRELSPVTENRLTKGQ